MGSPNKDYKFQKTFFCNSLTFITCYFKHFRSNDFCVCKSIAVHTRTHTHTHLLPSVANNKTIKPANKQNKPKREKRENQSNTDHTIELFCGFRSNGGEAERKSFHLFNHY